MTIYTSGSPAGEGAAAVGLGLTLNPDLVPERGESEYTQTPQKQTHSKQVDL